MVDPANPPQVSTATDYELQEFLMFTVAVAGKNANRTSKALNSFLFNVSQRLPLRLPSLPLELVLGIKITSEWRGDAISKLAMDAKVAGMGCYSQRARSFLELAEAVYEQASPLDIRACTIDELENIYGIGRKTSRFYISYTRPDEAYKYAILDTHILSWLRFIGHDAPKSTPKGVTRYKELETTFLNEAAKRGKSSLELDREIWLSNRKRR